MGRYIVMAKKRGDHVNEYELGQADTKDKAIETHSFFVECARHKTRYNGVLPWLVFVEDTKVPRPKEKFRNGATVPCVSIMLSQFVDDENDPAVGPWAGNVINKKEVN